MMQRFVVLCIDPRRVPREQVEWHVVTASHPYAVEQAMTRIVPPPATVYVFREHTFAMIAENLIHRVFPDVTVYGDTYVDLRVPVRKTIR